MDAERKRSIDVILPAPPSPRFPGLEPEEIQIDPCTPNVLNVWLEDGSMQAMLVEVLHKSVLHVKDPNAECRGKITVPISKGAMGSRNRYCNGCGQQVTVINIGAIRIDVAVAKRNAIIRAELVAIVPALEKIR